MKTLLTNPTLENERDVTDPLRLLGTISLIILSMLLTTEFLCIHQNKEQGTTFIENGVVLEIKCPKCLQTKSYHLKTYDKCTLEWSGMYRLQKIFCRNWGCRITMAVNPNNYYVMQSAYWREGDEFFAYDAYFT